jgi:two-component system chemotaxis response regulator CheY
MVVASLEMAHLETTSCSDAGAVLAEASGRKFDLLLLDYDQPGESAPDLCAQLRGQTAYQKTPIIFLTDENNPTPNTAPGVTGGFDFLSKPVSTAELAVKAQTWILKNQFGLL